MVSKISAPSLPPLPPPVGSSVLPSVSAGSPPPPSAPPPVPIVAPADDAVSDYGPPQWLREQRGEHRNSNLDPKFVILAVAIMVVILIVGGLVLALLGISADPTVVDVPPAPPLGDQSNLIDS